MKQIRLNRPCTDRHTSVHRKIKVLHLITELVVGGAQDNTFLTVGRLSRDQYEVDVAGAPGGEWELRAAEAADHVFLINSMKRGIYALDNAKALLEIMALLRQQRYDVVHTHSTNAGILGRLAARAVGTPIAVHTVHGFAFDDTTFSLVARKALVWLERLSAACCDRLVMVSELNKQEALRRHIAPAHKMVTIHSGIDTGQFDEPVDVRAKRAELGLFDDWPVVGFVGRLSTQNAPQVFVRAARQILATRPRVHFVVVGDGPLRSEVQSLAVGTPQLHLLGHREDVPRILPVLDIYVFSGLWAGLGRALTEAMIAARPVVASSINGVPEIVHHGQTGLLVPPNDPEAIARSVLYLLDNSAVAAKLGENARREVIPEFGADLMVRRIEALYEELLLEKGVIDAPR